MWLILQKNNNILKTDKGKPSVPDDSSSDHDYAGPPVAIQKTTQQTAIQ